MLDPVLTGFSIYNQNEPGLSFKGLSLPIRNDSKNDSTNDEQAGHDKKDGIAIIRDITTRNAETILTIMFIYFFNF